MLKFHLIAQKRRNKIEKLLIPIKSNPNISARFPCSVVWSPLLVISWFIPCIGHIGICKEDMVIFDFVGPNFVCMDSFAFGTATRY